jgi:hypothetical protein
MEVDMIMEKWDLYTRYREKTNNDLQVKWLFFDVDLMT